jgi:hypothetical protein
VKIASHSCTTCGQDPVTALETYNATSSYEIVDGVAHLTGEQDDLVEVILTCAQGHEWSVPSLNPAGA